MLVPHEPEKDPRIHWEAATAAKEFEVVVLGLQENPDKHPDEEISGNYRIVRETWTIGNDSRVSYLKYLSRYLLNPLTSLGLMVLAAILYPFCFILEFLLQLVLRILGLVISITVSFFKSILDRMITYRIVARTLARKKKSSIQRHSGPLRIRTECFFLIQKRLFHTTFALLRAYSKSNIKADLIHCNDLDTLLAGIILKERLGAKLVYDAHELWPVSFSEYPKSFIWLLRYFEKKLIRYADNTFIVSPDLASIMKKWYHVEKIGVLPNAEIYTDDDRALDTGMRRMAGNRIIFLFQGGYARDRGLEELIKGWRSVDGEKAVLFLRGVHNSFEDELRELAREQSSQGRIFFLPPVSEEDLVAASREADVGIIPYRPVNLNNKFCCPNKFSQYLQAGLALLVNDLPSLRLLVEKFNCGLSYDSSSPDTLISSVNRFIENREYLCSCKYNALKAARESFNWDITGVPLLEAYKNLLSDKIKVSPLKKLLKDFCVQPAAWLQQHFKDSSSNILERHRKESPWVLPSSHIERIRTRIKKEFADSAEETLIKADLACAREFTVLGVGPWRFKDEIDWSTDLLGRTWMKGSFEELRHRIYHDFPHNEHVIGDIKVPWDFNKHLHFFDIARAYILTGDEKYPREFKSQIESWWNQNPFSRNLAWMEPLIVAQRALSWLFAMRFLIHSPVIDEEFYIRFMASLYNHLQWIQLQYEIDDRSTNHLIGNIAGVLAITSFFPGFDISAQSEKRALELIAEQLQKQIYPDGVHYEQSVSYHRYVLEFLLSILLIFTCTRKEIPESIKEKTEKMAEYLMHMLSPDGQAHLISDADGARVFRFGTCEINNYRPHLALSAALFSNPHLAHQAAGDTEILVWALGPDAGLPERKIPEGGSKWFPNGGMVVMRSDWSPQAALLTFDCGNIGLGYTDELPHGTHGHDDLLSITVSSCGRQILADKGSGSYTGNVTIHEALRLSMGHNTLSLSSPSTELRDAAALKIESHSVPMGPWVLGNRACPEGAVFLSCSEVEYASCSHNGYRRFPGAPLVTRSIFYFRPEIFIIVDLVRCTHNDGRADPARYAKVLVPFQFHPDAEVNYDKNGGSARIERARVQYAVTPVKAEWKTFFYKGSNDPFKGWYAKDYGCCVPSPTVEYEVIASLPFRSAMLIRCTSEKSDGIPTIKWLNDGNGEESSALKAEIGNECFYIGLDEKGISSLPHPLPGRGKATIAAIRVGSTTPEKAWFIDGRKIEEIVL